MSGELPFTLDSLSPTVEERYAKKHLRLGPDACWPWLRPSKRHPLFYTGGMPQSIPAHRYAAIRAGIPVPDGMQVHHICGYKPCQNPAHLEVLTAAEHLARHPETLAALLEERRTRPLITHCRRGGHALTPDNIYLDGSNRRCHKCLLERQASYRRAKGIPYRNKEEQS